MKVHLLSAYSHPTSDYVPRWLYEHSSPGSHELVSEASQADLIVFAETYSGLDPYFFDVIRHPIYQKYPDKCVLYHISDTPQTLCRTISPSAERHQPNLQCRRSFSYITRLRDNTMMDQSWDITRAPKLLYSFMGDIDTHSSRRRIFELEHEDSLLLNASGIKVDTMSANDRMNFHKVFINSILDASFVLCPRGLGPTSMRLFEAMQLGRVPVIIGDSWLPVAGIDWSSCAIFVNESEIGAIPKLLEDRHAQASTMGLSARSIWQSKFSPPQVLSELITLGLELLDVSYGSLERAQDSFAIAGFKHWRNLGGYAKRNFFYP
ncbi:hypothetical protein BH11VER1_BH11VER1_10780 [soil metagenome]